MNRVVVWAAIELVALVCILMVVWRCRRSPLVEVVTVRWRLVAYVALTVFVVGAIGGGQLSVAYLSDQSDGVAVIAPALALVVVAGTTVAIVLGANYVLVVHAAFCYESNLTAKRLARALGGYNGPVTITASRQPYANIIVEVPGRTPLLGVVSPESTAAKVAEAAKAMLPPSAKRNWKGLIVNT